MVIGSSSPMEALETERVGQEGATALSNVCSELSKDGTTQEEGAGAPAGPTWKETDFSELAPCMSVTITLIVCVPAVTSPNVKLNGDVVWLAITPTPSSRKNLTPPFSGGFMPSESEAATSTKTMAGQMGKSAPSVGEMMETMGG